MLAGLAARARGERRQQLLAELAGPPLPAGTENLWSWFLDLSDGRGSGFGPEGLRWSDIMAWAMLRRCRPTQWELDVIRELDRTFRRVME